MFLLWACFALLLPGGCTVKHVPLPAGMIPRASPPTPGETEYGQQLFNSLCEDHELAAGHARDEQLLAAFDHLVEAAEADRPTWQIHLFDAPGIVDVRAVHGNYIFVWSGLLDIVQNEDEIAAVLAGEMAHALARHTEPVEFTMASDVFFSVAEMATSIAIMSLSHGMVAISGNGWMKWGYVHAADLDPLDREYDEAYEKEAAAIALLLVTRSNYSPQAMIGFWKRLQNADAYPEKEIRLNRNFTPQQRVLMLEELMPQIPEWSRQEADSSES
ncbi:MAG: M48 family metalloprotease [Deltaproteobacteria bacterium]|nr:M48 family metalloprotease [Deltaproteobacteria bacterium]